MKNTKEIIFNVTLDLLEEKSLENIQITEICEKAHAKAFSNRKWTVKYLKSDEFIMNMIHFFDDDTRFILLILKWNLLSYVTIYNTKEDLKSAKKMDDDFLKEHSNYVVMYLYGKYFNVCRIWVLENKKESIEELFKIIKYIDKL